MEGGEAYGFMEGEVWRARADAWASARRGGGGRWRWRRGSGEGGDESDEDGEEGGDDESDEDSEEGGDEDGEEGGDEDREEGGSEFESDEGSENSRPSWGEIHGWNPNQAENESEASQDDGATPLDFAGNRMAWDLMRPFEPLLTDDAVLAGQMDTPCSLGWTRIVAGVFRRSACTETGKLLGRFFRHPTSVERAVGTPEEVAMQCRLRGVRHFEENRAPKYLMDLFLPGVEPLQEVDELASALAKEVDTIARDTIADGGREAMARCREWYGQEDAGAFWAAFHVCARGLNYGTWSDYLKRWLPGSVNLQRYVKSLLFYGEDEMDCLCHVLGHLTTSGGEVSRRGWPRPGRRWTAGTQTCCG